LQEYEYSDDSDADPVGMSDTVVEFQVRMTEAEYKQLIVRRRRKVRNESKARASQDWRCRARVAPARTTLAAASGLFAHAVVALAKKTIISSLKQVVSSPLARTHDELVVWRMLRLFYDTVFYAHA
jgi:hypothetical protein